MEECLKSKKWETIMVLIYPIEPKNEEILWKFTVSCSLFPEVKGVKWAKKIDQNCLLFSFPKKMLFERVPPVFNGHDFSFGACFLNDSIRWNYIFRNKRIKKAAKWPILYSDKLCWHRVHLGKISHILFCYKLRNDKKVMP